MNCRGVDKGMNVVLTRLQDNSPASGLDYELRRCATIITERLHIHDADYADTLRVELMANFISKRMRNVALSADSKSRFSPQRCLGQTDNNFI